MRICVINASTKVSAAEAALMVGAVQVQLSQDVCPAWGWAVPTLDIETCEADVPLDAAVVLLVDDAEQSGALGFHDETPGGRPYARVFASPTLNAGGSVLRGALSVAAVLSHEILELVGDRTVNLYADGPTLPEGTEYALELCDACEADGYDVAVNGQDVTVSDFVLPAWFDPLARPDALVDYLGKCPGPFQLAPGGYMIVRAGPGLVQQVFGDVPPAEWRRLKVQHSASRTARRLGGRDLALEVAVRRSAVDA